MRHGPAPAKRSRGTDAKASISGSEVTWHSTRSSSAKNHRARARRRICGMSEAPHLHLDRTFGATVDELVDMRVARAIDLRGAALPDQAALVEHADAMADLARARHVVGDRHCGGAKIADAFH